MNDLSTTASLASRIQIVRSTSGIEAWLIEDYTVPLVAMEIAMRGGSSQDPENKPGTASFLAGLLDEGAGPYDASEFHDRLDDFAIELSFSASRDQISGQLRTLSRHREEAFDMFRLALNEARLDAEPVERVRAQLLASIRNEQNDPDAMANRAWFATAFAGHPYARPTKGTAESLPTITREDLVAYRSKILARETLKIAVVGAIDAATLALELERVFGALPEKAALTAIPLGTPAAVGTRQVIDLDIPQSSIRFGAAGLLQSDPDFVTASVLNHVLGGGMFSSRLFREVREKRGLAYSVSSQLASLNHGPLHMGGTSTKNERAAESLAIIEAEISSLALEGPNDEELDIAKKYLIGSYPLRFDTSTKLAGQLTQMQVENLGRDYMDRRNGLIAAVTREDATRVAKRLYGEGKLFVTVVGRPVGM
jgi:zinc protease